MIRRSNYFRKCSERLFRPSKKLCRYWTFLNSTVQRTLFFKARHIDLYAVGGSATVARDLSHKMLKIGIKSTTYDDAHIMLMSAAVLSDDDVVIAISHSGATRAVNDPVKLAGRNGAKVIVITNYAESPIARNAHVVLNSTSQGSHLLGENAASRIAQLNILDALFVAIAKKDLTRAEKNLMKTQRAVQDLRDSSHE